jgi:hypothetical protein
MSSPMPFFSSSRRSMLDQQAQAVVGSHFGHG